MTIYKGLSGEIAYTVEGDIVYSGKSKDVAFKISGDTVYEGLGANVAFKIAGDTVYRGLSNDIAFKISGNTIYSGLGGNIAYKIDSSSPRHPVVSTHTPSQNAASSGDSPDLGIVHNTDDWPNFFGEGSDIMNEIENFGRMSRRDANTHRVSSPHQPYTSPSSSTAQTKKSEKLSAIIKDFEGNWRSDDSKYVFSFMQDGTAMWGNAGEAATIGGFEISGDMLHMYPGEQRNFAISFVYTFSGGQLSLVDAETGAVTLLCRVNPTEGLNQAKAKLMKMFSTQ